MQNVAARAGRLAPYLGKEGEILHVAAWLHDAAMPRLWWSADSILSTARTTSGQSDDRVPIEQISRLLDYLGTSVTELVYRKQIRPVVEDGAPVMDPIFPRASG